MNALNRLFLFIAISFTIPSIAGEGMWIPSLLQQLNEKEMIEMGFRLSAEDIYSVNHSSMKDAVVLFGRGCTGEIVSKEGLLLTNHHCGLGTIQRHSSLENDYLKDGFWAMSREEELPNAGLSVTLLKRMEDVSDRILDDVTDGMNEKDREKTIQNNIDKIIEETTKGSHYEAYIRPFYSGNTYYLFVTEVFKDVRLVGAPPSSIGKFGGDTDNWMWPRHTGDFSVFRIYAGPDNKPAEYSKENAPYIPAYHFPISLKGYKEGDFTLVFGYPGSTQQFITSDAVEVITKVKNPIAIDARRLRLDIFEQHMRTDDKVRIQYTAKSAGLANGWKKWIGENRGIRKLKTIDAKTTQEAQFQEWATSTAKSSKSYPDLLPAIKAVYMAYAPVTRSATYIREAGLACELIRQAGRFDDLIAMAEDKTVDMALLKEEAEKMQKRMSGFFKDYDVETDKDVFAALMFYYYDNMKDVYIPPTLMTLQKKFKGDFPAMTEYVFNKTSLLETEELEKILEGNKRCLIKKLASDPAFKMADEFMNYYNESLIPMLRSSEDKLDSLYRIYVKAQMEMESGRRFYPDANLTLRVAYGMVDDFFPMDAVHYQHFTTLKGIMEKEALGVYDYIVPQKLEELYTTKDFGPYADADGSLHTCFTASNHTTGGNSGSPVVNADGQLIGINFDRNWEGTMSDIDYDPDQCRNISLDIRYCLFIIDKFAGARHLVDEMTLIAN